MLVTALNYLSTSLTCLGLFLGFGALAHSHLGRSYFDFVRWWGKRNYGLLFWGIVSGFATIFSDGGSGWVVTFAIVPLTAGVDFVVLLTGARAGYRLYLHPERPKSVPQLSPHPRPSEPMSYPQRAQ
jgi:hypothetical protein